MALPLPHVPAAPRHVAIIMDGNRRWSRAHGRSLAEGYKRGVDSLRAVVRAAIGAGVETLTVYGFSTENWQREASEVSVLMRICAGAAQSELFGLAREKVRVKIIGDLGAFPSPVRTALERLAGATAANGRLTLCLALNYSGRAEILAAMRGIARDVANGTVAPDGIDDALVRSHLYDSESPDPDLLIRTGGDLRISNFLLYQVAYTELLCAQTLWPDFGEADFAEALGEYARRKRSFGT